MHTELPRVQCETLRTWQWRKQRSSALMQPGDDNQTPQALLTQRWEERDHGKLSGALEVKKGLACRRNTWAEMSTMHWEPETSVFWSLVNVRSRKLFRVLHNCLLRLGDHSGRGDEKFLGARESRCLQQSSIYQLGQRSCTQAFTKVRTMCPRTSPTKSQRWERRAWWSPTPIWRAIDCWWNQFFRDAGSERLPLFQH